MEEAIRELLTITRAEWLGDPLERCTAQARDTDADDELGAAAVGCPTGRTPGTHRRAYRTGGPSHGHAIFPQGSAGDETIRCRALAAGQVKRRQKERR